MASYQRFVSGQLQMMNIIIFIFIPYRLSKGNDKKKQLFIHFSILPIALEDALVFQQALTSMFLMPERLLTNSYQ